MKRILFCLFAMIMSIFCFSACGEKGDGAGSNSSSQDSAIVFVQNELTLSVGDSVQAEVITSKKNVYVSWSIRDEELATVSDDGVITALAEGQTICYAKFAGETAMCLVKITAKSVEPMLSVSVPYEDNAVALYEGDSLDLKVSVKCGDEVVTGATISYDVKADLVSVENGLLNALAVGETTVQINVEYQGKTASLSLSVKVVAKA